MLVWLTLPFYDFCGFRSVAVNSVFINCSFLHLYSVLLMGMGTGMEIAFAGTDGDGDKYSSTCRALVTSSGTSPYANNTWPCLRLLTPVITHADARGGGTAFINCCLSVCPVFPHDISKTDAATITKLDLAIFYDESWKSIYFKVKKVKVMSH